jgi:methanogenic corrinoid protein MtbC1
MVRAQGAQIAALSALLTTTMPAESHHRRTDPAGLRGQVKVMIGGAPSRSLC